MKPITIGKLKLGEFFKMKATESSPVWVRGEYDKGLKAFSCHKFEDTNHERFITGKTQVYCGFEF